MDRFHLMTVFVAVAEQQGFAAAARKLHMSPPAVTRAIAALEDRLGVKLLNRTTRYVRATESGQRYLDDAKRILTAADLADEAAAGINADPRGFLSVTAPVLFGRMFVMPGIIEYLERYPGTEVSALLLDRNINLLEEGIDIGIRIGDLPDSTMRAIRVGSIRLILCASPSYLEKHGTPEQLNDLRDHSIIASSAGNSTFDWRFGHKSVQVKPRLSVNTNDAAMEAAIMGLGITRLLSYQIEPQLKSGKLHTILPDEQAPELPINIVHREGRYASAKVRSFVDLMAERLKSDPALHSID